VEIERHLELLESHGHALGARASSAGLDAPVPSCPDWCVRDLVQHVGNVHGWARTIVSSGMPAPPSPDEEASLFAPVPDERLLARYDDGLALLVATLRAAPPSLECWSFLPAPSPLAFWARRQCHETTVHAVDAGLAAGATADVEADLAADGLDELLFGFFSRARSRLIGAPAFSLSFHADDVGRDWTIRVDEEKASADDAGDGACRLTGPASLLYLFGWNRAPATDLRLEGAPSALEQWAARAKVVWS
jgi:uncharacterized protein (TIGR03083 family)